MFSQHVRTVVAVTMGIFFSLHPVSAEEFSASELDDLPSSTTNNQAGETFTHGDINGDGYDDLFIGAPNNTASTGAVYLIYGSSDGIAVSGTQSIDAADVTIDGASVSDSAGAALAMGDINGDGYDDLIIGAPDQGTSAGSIYILYGSAVAFSTTVGLEDIHSEFIGSAPDSAGQSIAVGDVNNDGFDDILVGATGNNSFAGAAYLIYGQADQFVAETTLESAAVKFSGENSEDLAGYRVAIGDVTGDGYGDLLIGVYGDDGYGTDSGAVCVVYGQATALTSRSLATADGKIVGESSEDHAAGPMATGDINSDGYDDLFIAVPAESSYVDSAGAIYLILGQESAFASSEVVPAVAEVKITGLSPGDAIGSDLTLGDVNHDGSFDLFVGAGSADTSDQDRGTAYLIEDVSSLLAVSGEYAIVNIEESTYQFTGVNANDALGTAVTMGDFNGDAFDDIAMSAPGVDNGFVNAGAIYYGALYIDADRDGVAGTSGFLANGTDCNDADPNGTTNITYYRDEDEDTLGNSKESTVECSNAAPTGYVANGDDIDDTIKNNGIEIGGDDVDNDGDGDIDEVNTVSKNGKHPEYKSYVPGSDQQGEYSYSNAVKKIQGAKNGNILVTYMDDSVYRYKIFDNDTDIKTTVQHYLKLEVLDTGFLLVLSPRAKKMAVVNAYNGKVKERETISKTGYKASGFKAYSLSGNGIDNVVITAKNGKTDSVLLAILRIDDLRDHKVKLKKKQTLTQSGVDPAKTELREEDPEDADSYLIINLRTTDKKTLRSYEVSQDYLFTEVVK